MLKQMKGLYTSYKNCSAKELLRFSELNESVIYLDCWIANERLVDYKAKKHYGVKHLKSEFANAKFHINAIVNFFTSLCS